MKNLSIIIVFLSFSFVSVSQNNAWRPGESEVKVDYHLIPDSHKFRELNLSGEFYKDHAIVYAIPEELKKMEQLGIQYEVLKKDMNAFSSNFWNSDVPTGYYEYQEIIDIADSLALHFPEICQKTIIGYSLGGRQLAVLKISDNVASDENEPEVFFDAGIHGDEIGGPENLIRFARELCLQYGAVKSLTDLVDGREIFLLLMVNPDGRVNMSRYNTNGIDLNRDWGYMWDESGGTPSEFSQQESKLLRNFVFDNQFVVHTTYHSGTEIISYPWSYRANQCPDQAHINYLASVYASESGYSNLEYAQGFSGMYPINGSTKDANYGIQGSVSWSMEISYEKQPPASQIAYYYTINKPSMEAMIEYSGYGLEGTVTDAQTGNPVPAVILINNYMQTCNDPEIGDYHKYVLPGTYSVKVIANGYEPQTVNNVTVNPESSTLIDFQLQPADGSYIYKIWATVIPDNNSGDEGNTKAVFGAPDNVNYSIGKNGRIVIDMLHPLIDGPGNDLRIYEGDASPESYTCFAGTTPDGPWVSIGTGTGTSDFDLSGLLSEAQFFKIVDDGDGNQVEDNAGFDLDAAEALEHVSGVYLAITDYFIDDVVSGNNNGILDPGETADLIVTVRNNGDITATDVLGIVSTGDPYLSIITTDFNFGNLGQSQTVQGSYTLQADPLTPEGHSASLVQNFYANSGSYTTSSNLSIVIGIIPIYLISQGGTLSVCDGTFYDSGGESGTYQNNEDFTMTFLPGSGADYVELDFTSFNTESGWDYLYVYNGPDMSSPLIGSYSGTNGPGTVTGVNGLTLRFDSDGTINGAGWSAAVSCFYSLTQGGTLTGSNTAVCLGSSTGNMSLSNNSGTISDWEKRLNAGEWQSIGITSETYSEIPSEAGIWDYRVEVDNGDAYSNSVSLVVNSPTVGGAVSGGSDICLGDHTGTMTLAGHVGAVQRWQKQLNGGTWSNITNSSTSYNEIPSESGTWAYRAVVKNGACSEVNSDAVNLDVYPVAVGGTASADNGVLCNGTSANLTLSGYSGNIQWQFSENTNDWLDIEGANSDTYTGSPLSEDTWYRAMLSLGECPDDSSNHVQITVLQNPVAGYTYEADNQTLSFTNVSTDADIYAWNFGDGTTSSIENPIHIYTATGDYTVSLTASNAACPDDVFMQTLYVSYVDINEAKPVFIISPNPSDGRFKVQTGSFSGALLTVYSIEGIRVCEIRSGGTLTEIDLRPISKGVYILEIQTNAYKSTQKIVIK